MFLIRICESFLISYGFLIDFCSLPRESLGKRVFLPIPCLFYLAEVITDNFNIILLKVRCFHDWQLAAIQGGSVLVFCGCCHELPQTWWLQTSYIYSLKVVEARSSK